MKRETWITVAAAAERLGWSWHRVRHWCFKKDLRSKVLPPFNRRVVSAADVERVRREHA